MAGIQNYLILHEGSNLGIAAALNLACKKALDDGFDKLLTMDQDSSFLDGDFKLFKSIATELNWHDIASLSPLQAEDSYVERNDEVNANDVTECMTSGSILNLTKFEVLGRFDENLFIDHVDHDYCYNALENGLRILVTKKLKLVHSLGDKATFRFFNYRLHYVSHSPLRVYYFIRNGYYIAKKHPKFAQKIKRLIRREILKSLLFENERSKYVKFIMQALKDYSNNKLGKYKG